MKLKNKSLFLFFIFLFFLSWADLDIAKNYEERAENSYKYAKVYRFQQDYLKSLVSYVNSITYYTLAFHLYIDKLKDKENFFRVGEKLLIISVESDEVADKAYEKTNDQNKKINIMNIKASNCSNFASVLEKMYGVDYKVATKKYQELIKESGKSSDDSIILFVAKNFAKAIDVMLSVNNIQKAKEYFNELQIFYKTLDNRVKDKYNVRKIVEFYKKKLGE